MKYPFRLLVDGETFEVSEDRRSGSTIVHFSWISGPDPAYGFSTSRSDAAAMDEEEAIRLAGNFLKNIDPATGYLPD